MKHLVYRNVLGSNPLKREVSIEETSSRARKRIIRRLTSKYFVKEKFETDSIEGLKQWIRLNRHSEHPRNCHIITMIDSKTGEYKIACKVLGVFFLICKMTVYKIVYVNHLKIQMTKERSR
jgi:hypothetical protein